MRPAVVRLMSKALVSKRLAKTVEVARSGQYELSCAKPAITSTGHTESAITGGTRGTGTYHYATR
jgi:hypothetical protein